MMQDVAHAKESGVAVDKVRLRYLQGGADYLKPSALLGVAGDDEGVPSNLQDGLKKWR